MAAVPISGAFFNPFVATAVALWQGYAVVGLWPYWIGPLVGGALAPAVFLLMAPHEFMLVWTLLLRRGVSLSLQTFTPSRHSSRKQDGSSRCVAGGVSADAQSHEEQSPLLKRQSSTLALDAQVAASALGF